ncbi:MAG: FAD-dependent oxidoreductase [Cyanobacteria bacterium]|nr:FAD-dependent oxidoreductase [Cyanobacteriota bacterium]
MIKIDNTVMNNLKADVAIIGAGITGCAIARELSKYKIRTVVLEKEADVGWGTTKANSGLIHPGYAGDEGTLKLKMCHTGSLLFRKNAEELDIPMTNNGSMLNALRKNQIGELEHNLKQGKKYGVRGLKIIFNSNSSLKEIEPNISSSVLACLYSEEHYLISPYEAAIAIYENSKTNGVYYLLSSKVTGINYNNISKKFYIVALNTLGYLNKMCGKKIVVETDYIINAAGVFADEISEMAGDGFYSIKAVKGQYFLLDSETHGFVRRPNFRISDPENIKSKGMVIGPTIDKNLLIGSTYEATDKYDNHTSAEVLEEIKEKFLQMFEEIPFDKVITSFTGLRAIADTGDFVLGPSKVNEKFINAAGIQSPGLTCAFLIAEMTVDFLEQKGLNLLKNSKYMPLRKKAVRLNKEDFMLNNALYEKDSNYSEIICRCEKVSRAEIIDAINKGATTLDGIKFRTRAGMGRCQGGYCTLKVMKILSKELGLPFNEITKSGEDSYIAGCKME